MSEFFVRVVRLGKIGKHPNADTLSITQVGGRYPVILKTGAFKEGDLAVHIPPDALVCVNRPEFSWLADKAVNGMHRVRFSKIRGVPSYGFFVPVPEGAEVVEGQDVRELLGVEKYEGGPCYQLGGDVAGDHYSGPELAVVPHYDIHGLRAYERLFQPGEAVVVTEKIHGSNGRWTHINGTLHCGSRTRFRRNSVWNRMAEKYNLEAVLGEYPGLVLYGEVYGPKIQDLTYGATEHSVLFFDVYDTRDGLWWSNSRFQAFLDEYNLPRVPVLHCGGFDLEQCYALAEGKSTLADHVREGIVVRPETERWDQRLGRVQLKLPGEGYLLRKSA